MMKRFLRWLWPDDEVACPLPHAWSLWSELPPVQQPDALLGPQLIRRQRRTCARCGLIEETDLKVSMFETQPQCTHEVVWG